jgi:hypothetical protein
MTTLWEGRNRLQGIYSTGSIRASDATSVWEVTGASYLTSLADLTSPWRFELRLYRTPILRSSTMALPSPISWALRSDSVAWSVRPSRW